MAKERSRYSSWTKQQVKIRYPLCRNTADKKALAKDLNILDAHGEGDVAKLYNLASRVGATGRGKAEEVTAAVANSEEMQRRREDPRETKFSREADRYIRKEFGRRPPSHIAIQVNHSETAVAYRARHLGLRKPVKYWDARKVAFWLGLSNEELHDLYQEGIDITPLHYRNGHLALEVVSTVSLARWLQEPGNIARVRERGADEFFLLEIQESVDDKAAGKTDWELCKFLSHGHVCMNAYAEETSFGEYCTNNDRHAAGDDPACSVRNLHITDLRPG